MRFRSLAMFVGIASFSSVLQAGILIDDFEIGEAHHTMGGFENSWGITQEGLDENHVLFGYRGTQMTIQQNQFHVPIQVDIGIGETRVSTTSIVSSTMSTQYVDRSRVGANLSFGDRINIDLYTLDPPDRFADSYFVVVRDADLTLRVINKWVLRPGGVYFNKSDFGADIDWSKIINIEFGHQFSTNFGLPPLVYGVSKIEVVPEPGTLVALGLGWVAFVSRGLRRQRSA